MMSQNESIKRQSASPPNEEPHGKKIKAEIVNVSLPSISNGISNGDDRRLKRPPMSKARENRLEQNRKAARESRRRKKLMIEELQRSVIFFSKANGTLKMQNDELSRRLLEAQAQITAIEGGKEVKKTENKGDDVPEEEKMEDKPKQHTQQTQQSIAPEFMKEQVRAQAAATQALYESQGFPSGAARAAAQAMNASTAVSPPLTTNTATTSIPQMQPGATMQAMATFQQAAAAAMQAALGMNPAAGNPQQNYADAMNAFAQQSRQALFTAQQQQGIQQAFMGFNPVAVQMAWAQQQQQQQTAAPKPAPVDRPIMKVAEQTQV